MLRLVTLNGLAVFRNGAPLDTERIHKPLALLAVVAAAGEDGLSRDRLQALFWPESDAAHARGGLKQAHYMLRRALGVDPWIPRGTNLAHDSSVVAADVIEFRAAIARGDLAAAVDLYRGRFLEGFFLRDLPDFDEFVEEERARLHEKYIRALDVLANQGVEAQDFRATAEWRRRIAAADPLDARAALLYMEALVASGAREQALRIGREHIALVREELGGEPDPTVVRQVETLAQDPQGTPAKPFEAISSRGAAKTAPRAASNIDRSREFRWVAAAAIVLVVTTGVFAARGIRGESVGASPSASNSLDAKGYYLRARKAFAAGLTERDMLLAAQLFGSATLHDSSFALAWAGLSRANAELYWSYYDRSAERLEAARSAAERALRLDPALSEGHLALGYYYYYGFLKYDDALREFDAARQRAPNDPDVFAATAYVQRRQGKWEDAVANLRRALELDSLSYPTADALGDTFRKLRRVSEARPAFERAIRLQPGQADPYVSLSELELGASPDLSAARDALRRGFAHVDAPAITRAAMLSGGMLIRVFPDEFDRALRGSTSSAFGPQPEMYFLGKAIATGALSHQAISRAYFDSARAVLEPKAAASGDMLAFYHDMLAIADAGVGHGDEARGQMQISAGLLSPSRDASNGPNVRLFVATVDAMVGDAAGARRELDSLLARPSLFQHRMIAVDPLWSALR